MTHPIFKEIEKEISNNDVVIFMKGTAQFPQCGFSAAVVQIMAQLGVTFKDINVLEDNLIREGIKEFSDWPTIPQIYVKGEFLGGCDIIREMYDSGELEQYLKDNDITCTATAA